jgi:chemotaxis protein histidine kinase CheA
MGAVAAECAAIGGTMEIESRAGEGTCVRFRVPSSAGVPGTSAIRFNTMAPPALA